MDDLKYAYNHIHRFPASFGIMVICIALSTFCILSSYSIVEDLKIRNQSLIARANQQVNYNQLEIATKTVDRPVTEQTLEKALSIEGAVQGYYYEDLSYYLWQYGYLAPWIEWNEQLNIELSPILLNVQQAQAYGLDQKIVYGQYFSGAADEAIISLELFNKFIHKDKVIQDNKSIISEENRNLVKRGSGESIDLGELVGESVSFMYAIEFGDEFPQLTTLHSTPLKIIGVYDPDIGYKTQGDVWLPMDIKERLTALDFANPESNFSGKAVIRTDNITDATALLSDQNLADFLMKRTESLGTMEYGFTMGKVQQSFYSLAFTVSVVISLVSVMITTLLMITRRTYEFILQRALGMSRGKQVRIFTIEIFIVATIGTLLGLLITLVLLQSGLLDSIGFYLYLPGSTTLLVIILIPFIVAFIAYLFLLMIFRKPIASGLVKER